MVNFKVRQYLGSTVVKVHLNMDDDFLQQNEVVELINDLKGLVYDLEQAAGIKQPME